MPLEIQRTATVYQLWNDDDVHALFEDHAAAGWLSTLACFQDNGLLCWRVTLQNTANQQLITASTDHVIVSDLVTVVAQSVADYNTANPEHTIEAGS